MPTQIILVGVDTLKKKKSWLQDVHGGDAGPHCTGMPSEEVEEEEEEEEGKGKD